MDFDNYKSRPNGIHVTIRPSGRWTWQELSAIWEYRELLLFLTWRDIRVKYRQALAGLLWVIIQPIATMFIFNIFFSRMMGLKTGGVPYPLFAFSGIVPWLFFSNAVINSSNSLVGNTNLITKVYFPRMIIPGAAVLAGLVDFLIAMVVVMIMMLWFDVELTSQILLLPLLVLLTALMTFGLGMLMAALNVRYRDVRHALPFLLQLLMFATPIFYPPNLIPSELAWFVAINPLSGLIGGYRAALLGQRLDWAAIALTATITLIMLIIAFWYFRRTEDIFADIV